MMKYTEDNITHWKENIDELEWKQKTCQHISKLIADEQLLLNEVLHPEVVEETLEFINVLLTIIKQDQAIRSTGCMTE